MLIPFNKPYLTGFEGSYLKEAIRLGQFSGKGKFTKKCEDLIKKEARTLETLLVPSGTAGLEISAILLDIKKGDEVLMPSYTFPSTANAICLRGARPVFIDISEEDLNIDLQGIEKSVTKKTKAIFNVNYGGVSSNLDQIKNLSSSYNLYLVEDAAHGLGSSFEQKPIGSFGHLSIFSFHDTKNVFCGEGGAININDPKFIQRAKFIQEMGTDRALMREGKKRNYSWVDIGSSYLMSDILAAFLFPQLLNLKKIIKKRRKIYSQYTKSMTPFAEKGLIKIQKIPYNYQTNFHIFYILLKNKLNKNLFMKKMKSYGIMTSGHFFPLHASLMGKKFGYKALDLPISHSVYDRIVRLPIWPDMTQDQIDYVCDKTKLILGGF